MKKGIHPEYVDTTVTCGCGNTFQTRSSAKEIKVEICSRRWVSFSAGKWASFWKRATCSLGLPRAKAPP